MEKFIQDLYLQLDLIYVANMVYQTKNNIEEIGKLMPKIEKFVLWFLEDNKFGLEERLYQDMSINLIGVLKDMESSIQNGDRVLLHDAAAYGLSEYLRVFIPAQEVGTNDDL